MNLCRDCGLDFASVRAFDQHRVGKHAHLYGEGLRQDPPVEDGRRCLHAWELEPAGFAIDGRGRWFLVEHRAQARHGFSRAPGTSQRYAG